MWGIRDLPAGQHRAGHGQDPSHFLRAASRHGLLVGKGGLYGNVIRLTPMLDVTSEELDAGIDAIRSTIADLA